MKTHSNMAKSAKKKSRKIATSKYKNRENSHLLRDMLSGLKKTRRSQWQ
jgi:hypothetical protein